MTLGLRRDSNKPLDFARWSGSLLSIRYLIVSSSMYMYEVSKYTLVEQKRRPDGQRFCVYWWSELTMGLCGMAVRFTSVKASASRVLIETIRIGGINSLRKERFKQGTSILITFHYALRPKSHALHRDVIARRPSVLIRPLSIRSKIT